MPTRHRPITLSQIELDVVIDVLNGKPPGEDAPHKKAALVRAKKVLEGNAAQRRKDDEDAGRSG